MSSLKVVTVTFAVWGKESVTKTIYKLLLNALKLFAPVEVIEFHTTNSFFNLNKLKYEINILTIDKNEKKCYCTRDPQTLWAEKYIIGIK